MIAEKYLGKAVFKSRRGNAAEPFFMVHQDERGFLAVRLTDSVAFLVYVTDLQKVVLVRQKRGPMRSADNPEGFILEVPAGRLDSEISVRDLIAQEASEEIGATVDPSNVDVLNDNQPLALSPGILTERTYLAVIAIHSSQLEQADRVFGVDEDEHIERLLLDTVAVQMMDFNDMKTFALVQWFLRQRQLGRYI